MPAQAGIQAGYHNFWIPACAGMTKARKKNFLTLQLFN